MTSTEDETTKTRKDENIASEMEAAGLTSHIPTLIIRGVCDYADSTKNRLWQKYFAQTAKELVELTANIHGEQDMYLQHSYG
jgi:nucleoside phosphorylase